ncbi:membrane-associated protein [Deinobacterium chartae]|uniref:Membrane-associated protein n=1 Tax=Deinobacterium chartae TaxID=521158 RepID=A0A841HUS6_9DEIO|nr:VTT domain-containing protein [Deinobacterium chartae]MBB6097221.1 membrane-associated protein [Deinobacterium chartae]
MFEVESLQHLLRTGSYLALLGIVFAETGLLVGFFLPGDSLLLVAGIMSAVEGGLNIWGVMACCVLAAIVGDTVGYLIGRRFGPAIFNRPESRFFKPEHVQRSYVFFQKHGGKTIILARFVPFVRTFAPTIAGVSGMHYPTFLAYNVIGAVLWGAGVPLVGYLIGNTIPATTVDKYILLMVAVVVGLSLLPVLLEAWKLRKKAA